MYIHVNVTAGAREDSLEIVGENRYKIKTKAKAERNMANKAVVAMVAKHLVVPAKAVRIINGGNSPSKLISVLISENGEI